MQLCGLQKLTLLDYPEKLAATIFLGGCNFCCPFCHNPGLVTRQAGGGALSPAELLAFLETRRGLLDGVCLTGGEPLLSRGLEGLIRPIREMGFAVKLDTNGSLPDRLSRLLEAGLLDYVAMDIKNAPEKYAQTAGLPALDLAPVRESAALLMAGTVPYEFRTTLVRELHTPEDVTKIGRWLRGADAYYLQAFADSGALLGQTPLHGFSGAEMRAMAALASPYFKRVGLRGV